MRTAAIAWGCGAIAGWASGAIAGWAITAFVHSIQPPPITEGDLRVVMELLKPHATTGPFSSTERSIWVWGDGDIMVSVKTPSDVKLVGHGATITDALHDLGKKAQQVMGDASPIARQFGDIKP